MSQKDLLSIAEVLSGIASGATWEIFKDGEWIEPEVNTDPIRWIERGFQIRLKCAEPKVASPQYTCQTICEAFNLIPADAICAYMEFPADDLHALALSHHKQTMMIEKLCEMLEASERTSKAVRAEAYAVLKGGKA